MTAVLEILSGDLEGRSYDIDEAPFTIGRKEDCAIVLPKKYVSRKHAEIVEKNGRYAVRGLSEKNPIFANGKDVEVLELEEGTEFEICGIRFRFRKEGHGANKKDRAEQKVNSLVSGAVGSGAPTRQYRRDSVKSGDGKGDDIEDGPLPGEDEESRTEAFDAPASGEGKIASGASLPLKSGSGSGEQWRPEPGEGPRGRVVFGDDEPAPTDAKKSQKGSGDDKEERTDQIDVSKFKPTEDPFADKKPELTPEQVAQREKFIRVLVAVGAVGIVIASGLVWWLTRQHGPIPEVKIDLKPSVAVDEVRRYDEPLNEKDLPDLMVETPLDGAAVDALQAEQPDIAYVEWAVPDVHSTGYFLVKGISPGDTSFLLRFHSGASRRYFVHVEGVSKHAQLKKARTDRLATLGADELKKEISDRIRQGEELDKALLTPGPKQERYPRQALHDYELAEEALDALRKVIDRQQIADPDIDVIGGSVKSHLEKARETWRQAVTQKKKSYDDLVKRKFWEEAVKELQSLLWLVGDQCDLDYMRWNLLLDKVYVPNGYKSPGSFDGPGCIEENK